MSTFSVQVIPGFLPQDGQPITPAQLRAIALPTINLVGAFSSISIADGSVTENKLAASVAGDGLGGGAGVKLKVVPDGGSLEINASKQVGVKAGGIGLQHLGFGAFLGATTYGFGQHGLVPAPKVGQQTYGLRGDGTWYDFIGASVAAQTAALAASTQYTVFMARNFS